MLVSATQAWLAAQVGTSSINSTYIRVSFLLASCLSAGKQNGEYAATKTAPPPIV